MCVTSMIYDHYQDKWDEWYRQRPFMPNPFAPITLPPAPPAWPVPFTPITPEEVAEFRKLLERAREYDKAHNEPDCELEEKRQKLKKLAEELGVAIDFV